ncbi:DegV family protein [Ruminococcus sp. YE282]|uniref:DegV family protein n=1 Tax=Ruminococcus sp. YE282 TaxID=3158780 RepID=UPI00088ED939|nr:EDD domain protein, DegV family [Ruminococcus bromii]
MIGIVTDSSADLPLSFYKEHENVVMMPLTVRLGLQSLKDWYDISPEFGKDERVYTINEFYEKMAEKKYVPRTVPVTVSEFQNIYNVLSSKCDTIISIHFSHKLGYTVEQAKVAAKRINNCNVIVIDTLQISNGYSAMIREAVNLRDRGASAEDIVKLVNSMISSLNSKLIMTNPSSEYLHRCGRMSTFKFVFANIVKLKNFTITDGMITPMFAYKGENGLNRLINEMIKELVKEKKSGKKVYAIISHANCENSLKKLERLLIINNIDYYTQFLGPITGVYGGPGTWAVMPVIL